MDEVFFEWLVDLEIGSGSCCCNVGEKLFGYLDCCLVLGNGIERGLVEERVRSWG